MTKTKISMKRSRSPLEDYVWPIFVAACGGRCVACGQEGDLQRGHVQRHEDGGPDALDNLQPLCAECNGRHNKNFSMEDWRPPAWRGQFVKLFAQGLRTELRVAQPSQKNGVGCTTLDAGKPIENAEVIPWDRAIFSFNFALSLPLTTPTHPYPLEVYQTTVAKVIRRGADHAVPIPPPDERCQSKMCALVPRLGHDDFLAAAKEFLRQEKWFDDSRRRVMPHPWQTFADNANLYLKYAGDWERRQAKRRADEQANALAIEKYIADERAAFRWRTLRTGAPDWPEMTDEDREFLGKVRALPDEQQAVSDEDLKRAQDIWTRNREHWQRSQNYKLLQGIEHIKKLMCGSEYHKWKADDLAEFRRLEALVKAASYNAPELDDYKQQLIHLKPNRWRG